MTTATVKLCECGCGDPAPLAPSNNRSRGWVKGEPQRFIRGHYHRGRPKKDVRYIEEDRGYKTPCWIWQLVKIKDGYGRVTVNGRLLLAHRYMYEQAHGSIPEEKQLDHLCRVRDCVNPDHLEPVTHLENSRRGDRCFLNPESVREIRRLAGDLRYVDLAERFNVTPATIGHVVRRVTWKEVV